MTTETPRAVAGVIENPKPAPIEPAELEEVLLLCGAFEKTLRVFRLYPSNNKIFIDFTDDLVSRFSAFLEVHHEFRLDVDEHRFLYKRNVVYEETGRDQSTPMKLFRDAIRRLVFFEGLTKEEMLGFLEVVTRPLDAESIDDDLVTLLWEKDFSHISYYVLDDPGTEGEEAPNLSRPLKHAAGPQGDAGTTASLMKARNEKKGKYISPRLSARSMSTVMTITDHDLEAVTRMIAHENSRSLRHDLTTLLFELLDLNEGIESFSRVISILGQLIQSYLVSGGVREATEILRKFRDMVHTSPTSEHAEFVRSGIERSVALTTLREVGRIFEQPIVKGANDLAAFFRLVGPDSIPVLLDTLPRARNPQVVIGILTDLAREEPSKLLERLSDANPTVLRNVISVLGSIENPAIEQELLPHLGHPVVAVRLEVVRALARLGGSSGTEGLVLSLADPDYQVRVHALRCIDEMRRVGVLPHLMEMTATKEFQGRNVYEKQEFFRTIARLGGEDVLPFLENTIDARGFIRFSRSDEVRACATAAIAEIPGEMARSLLELYSRSSTHAVRDAAGVALRRMRVLAAERVVKGDTR